MASAHEVPIDSLVVDSRVQPRVDGLRESHVRALIEALRSGAALPPLLVTPYRDGRHFIVLDGAHRLEALKRAQARTVQIVVRDGAGFWEAFEANQKHGLPLTVADRKCAAVWLRQHRPELSVREIARMVGLGASTVQDALSGRRRESAGGGLIQRPDPWRRFLQALVNVYTRRGHEQNFVQRLAEALVDLVEGQPHAGTVWDSLSALADAIDVAWDLTEDRYAQQNDKAART
jgi:hypothetical protein